MLSGIVLEILSGNVSEDLRSFLIVSVGIFQTSRHFAKLSTKNILVKLENITHIFPYLLTKFASRSLQQSKRDQSELFDLMRLKMYRGLLEKRKDAS